MISVVLATFNGEKFIEKQLISIRNQSLKADEVIIADDNSTDNTVNIIQQFIHNNSLSSWKLNINTENKGFQKNFLNLLEMAKGDIIFLADQDDIWIEDKIKHMNAILQQNPDIWSLSSNFRYIDANGNNIPGVCTIRHKKKIINKIAIKDFLNDWCYPGMCMAIKTESLQYLKYIENIPLIAHDWAINIICVSLGKMYFYNEVLALYRQHENNLIGSSSNPVHDFRSNRKHLITEKIRHYKQAAEILSLLPSDIINYNMINFIQQKEIIYRKRCRCLEDKNLRGTFGLVKYLEYYPSVKTYLGDLLCCFLSLIK